MNSKFVKKLAACIVASCLMATVAVPTVANAAGANYSVALTSIVDTTTNYRERLHMKSTFIKLVIVPKQFGQPVK